MTPNPTPDAPVVPTLTLAGFVSDRLDEKAAKARAATPGPWRHNPEKEWHTDPAMLARAKQRRLTYGGEEFVGAGPLDETVCVAATGPADDARSAADAAHIATNDPAAVLASVEADRRILAPHIPDREHPDPWAHDVCPACTRYGAYDHTVVYEDECPTLRALASKWATHPDYREDWRP